jgi:thiamine biosynthesis lipoprotein ApbE
MRTLEHPTNPASVTWRALGTQVRLVVTGQELDEARRILAADLAEVDVTCSRFRSDSEIRTLITPRGQVSSLLAEAIGVALRAARLTDGDVDPTVGGAMRAIGYDRDFAAIKETVKQTVKETIEETDQKVTPKQIPGWRNVRLDGRILTLPPGAELDLGATAKAWAADRSAHRIANHLGCGVLVGLGGDIAVAGPPPPEGWRIRVQDVTGDPDDKPEGPYANVAITAGGLATSSIAARRWRRGGDVLHHILDPRTGRPAAPVWRTVSVAAGTCADANAASTAAIIRGRDAMGWLTSNSLPARLVDTKGTVFTVAGWPDPAPESVPDPEPRQ